MRSLTRLAGTALAALSVASCDNAVEAGRPGTAAGGPAGPRYSVGATSTVVVTCPAKMQTSQAAPCVAYGRDANGFYTSSTVTTWASTNTTYGTVTSGGVVTAGSPGTATIQATIGGVTGAANITVRTSTDPTVTLTGSLVVQANTQCTWTADGGGGTGPYTYSYSVTSPATGSQVGDSWVGQTTATFNLTATATDIDGRKGSHVYLITVVPSTFC